MIRNVKDMKRVPCYQRDSLYAGADAYRAIEKTTGETSGKGFSRTPKKSHEVASSIHSIYEAEEIYKREKTYNQKAYHGSPYTFDRFDLRAKLEQDAAEFSHSIDLFMDGKLKGGNVKVMTTPLVMKLVGAEILPIETSTTVLSKILYGKHSNELDENIVKQIPRALTDPVAVFQSKTKKGRLVVALELKDKNKSPIVVPFALDISSNPVDTSNGYYMNFITSAYGKDYKGRPNIKWFYDEINAGRMCYGNKKKLTKLLGTAGLYLPQPPKSNKLLLDVKSVPNETDLVKLKNENPEYYQQKEEYAGAYEVENNAIHILLAGNEADVYKAIEKTTGETSGNRITSTAKKSHEVASSIHNIYEAEEIYKREKIYMNI